MVQADLHFHTCYSPDATNNPKHVVEKLNSHPTLKAIAITDHNTTEGYHKTRELAKAYKDILIIPGVEVSAEEGEIILLGAVELPPRPWTASNIIAYAKQNDILTIAAHPYRGLGMGDQALNFDLDAIETLNGITSKSLNQKAEKLAAAKGLPSVAGSDSHFPHDPWNAYTEVDAALDVDEILAAIRKGAVKTFLR